MTVKIEFKTNNSAFEDFEGECARILEKIIQKIQMGDVGDTITDINGNTVGKWIATNTYTEED